MTAERPSQPVSDFVWIGDRPAPDLARLAAVDPASMPSDLSGQFALHLESGTGEHALVRDALGVNKLFFCIGEAGRLDVSNYWIDLVRRGHRAGSVWSVPSGHRIRIDTRKRTFELFKHSTLCFNDREHDPQPDAAAQIAALREALETTFRRLRPLLAGRPLYVTLSGGLDSTTIAVLAREWLGEFVGVTFSVAEDGCGDSHDLHFARRVAHDLGVPLETVQLSRDEIVALLDTALVYGQDWRDFNVHCALVNAAIGQALRHRHAADRDPRRPVVLSGDAANELTADYQPVAYGARDYYPLPRLTPGRLRRFLVGGLDAGDREAGVFAHFGIDVIQPFALCAAAYAAVSGSLLGGSGAKQSLTRLVLGDRIPPYVYERPKVRAQVADAERVGGTLAALVDRGIDAIRLADRFAELFGLQRGELATMIRGGFYRFPTRYPQ